jgi:hypothetical protein
MEKMVLRPLLWLGLVCGLTALGCGGHGAHGIAPPETASPTSPPARPQDAGALFPGLPALPAGSADVPQPRAASVADNIQTGSQALQASPVGAFVEQTRLAMGPLSEGKYAWGLWRWGKFTNPLVPRQLAVQLELEAPNKYWLLFANYNTGRWEVQGPLNAASQVYDFPNDGNYVSPAGNTYIALFAMSANTLVVDSLNLIADADVTAPHAPTSLFADIVLNHSARLQWTAPADTDLDHYELYQVPNATATETDPNAIPIDLNIPPTDTKYVLAPLDAETAYIYRLLAVDTAGNKSPLSVAANFTTLANQPPVPAFTFAPQPVMKNVTITFDPAGSTDPDDLPAKLTLFWDWNGDGVDDAVGTGLSPITHAFHQQGITSVRLSIFDGTDRVSTSQTVQVQPFETSKVLGYEQSGEYPQLLATATDYTTGRIAVAMYGGGGPPRLMVYHNGGWTTEDLSALLDNSSGIFSVISVALAPGDKTGVLLTGATNLNHPLQWLVYETTGSGFTLAKSFDVPPADSDNNGSPDINQDLPGPGQLVYAPNGRMSVGFAHSRIPPGINGHEDYFLTAYHELANGNIKEGDLMWRHAVETDADPGHPPFDYYGHWPATPFAISRTNTTTTLVCTEARTGQIQTDVVTDSASTASDVQGFTGTEVAMTSGTDPTDTSRMAWTLSTKSGTLFFGDNYGAANSGGQSFATGRTPLVLLSALPAGDNKVLFYWADLDANDETYLRGRNSGTGAMYEVAHGVGLCGGGGGGWISRNSQDGVFVVADEQRDGQITGSFITGATLAEQETIAAPLAGGHVFTHSLALGTQDGGLTILAAQERPTALIASAASYGGNFDFTEFGSDTWASPDCASIDSVPGEILLGSLYVSPATSQTDLILNRFAPGNSTGTHVGTVQGVKQAWMDFNPKVGQPMLVCLLADGLTLNARLWNGAAWGSPATIFTAPDPINEAVLRARPDGEWGLAWNEFDSTLRLTETTGGAWAAPSIISTAQLHLRPGSVDLQYSPNSDAGLAVERMDAEDGVYFGYKPAGDPTVTWELTSGTKGLDSDSLEVHWLPEWGAVVTYNVDPLISGGGLRLATRLGLTWNTTSLPFYLRGAPLSSATSPDGTMAWAGQDISTGQGTVAFLNW